MKLNGSWKPWVEAYRKFRVYREYAASGMSPVYLFKDVLAHRLSVNVDDPDEFRLACVAWSIVKWSSHVRDDPDTCCGLCFHRFIVYPGEDCGSCLVYEIFSGCVFDYCTKLHPDEIREKLYEYYTKEYNKLYKGDQND